MGNCLGKGNKNDVKDKGGMKLDPRRRSFSKRVDPWEKTGMVAFRSSNLKVSRCRVLLCLHHINIM